MKTFFSATVALTALTFVSFAVNDVAAQSPKPIAPSSLPSRFATPPVRVSPGLSAVELKRKNGGVSPNSVTPKKSAPQPIAPKPNLGPKKPNFQKRPPVVGKPPMPQPQSKGNEHQILVRRP